MILDPCLSEAVQPLIKEYFLLTKQCLVDLIDASYLSGSIAPGEFNEHFSYIDFVAILSRRASPIDLGHLRTMRKSIEKTYPIIGTAPQNLSFIVHWDSLIIEMRKNLNA